MRNSFCAVISVRDLFQKKLAPSYSYWTLEIGKKVKSEKQAKTEKSKLKVR